MSCNVCCEPFNKSTRASTTCYIQSCRYTCCKDCIRKYLVTVTSEPHCMHCRNKWSLEFCKQALNTSYLEYDYRNHRKNILADMMIAKIPEYYEGALRYGKISEHHKKLNAIEQEIQYHRQAINELYAEHARVQRDLHETPSHTYARKFVMQCQTSGCRGMLSTQYKCDVCTKFTCPKCFVSKDEDEHVCNPDDVATVEELRKNSRPCPNCGCRISKIDGCFGANVPVLLWSGDSKMSQDIVVGDTLVGDDGTPRTVGSVVSGTDQLYWVKQKPTGDSYIVSSKHKLVLYHLGDIVEMEVDAYLQTAYPEDYQGIRRFYNTKILTELEITPCGQGTYYGWTIDNNKRFLLADKTVVHNCDQMWCVECKTAFSWTNGTIETGVVHNPHYYQWMRQHGDHQAEHHNRLCGEAFQYSARTINRFIKMYMLEAHLEEHKLTELGLYYSRFHRYINHMEYVYLQPLINDMRARTNNHEPIYRYILNEIDKDALGDMLVDKDNANAKQSAYRDILEALIVVGKQLLIDCMLDVERLPCAHDDAYARELEAILLKYKRAITEYCAYSQIETIKYLMTYNSKKIVCFWDIDNDAITDMQFKTKTEMIEHIDYLQKKPTRANDVGSYAPCH